MNYQEISDCIKAHFGEAVLEVKLEGVFDPFIKVAPDKMLAVAEYLRGEATMLFDFMMCLSGVDLGKGNLGVTYHLFSLKHKHKITVKVEIPVAKAEVP